MLSLIAIDIHLNVISIILFVDLTRNIRNKGGTFSFSDCVVGKPLREARPNVYQYLKNRRSWYNMTDSDNGSSWGTSFKYE